MDKIFIIKGLDCANCALNLERKINKLEGVNSCSINFLAGRMIANFEEGTFEKIVDICNNFEDGVTLKRIK